MFQIIYNIAALVSVSILIYISSKLTEFESKEGFMFSVYPWITTFPETFSTLLYILKGLHGAAIANSLLSGLFDASVVFGVSTIVHGDTDIKVTDLVFIAALSGIVFCLLVYDGCISYTDSIILLVILVVASIYSIARYGMYVERLSGISIARISIGFLLSAVTAYMLVSVVESIIPYVGEFYGGTISAVLTSIPDIVVAYIYGLRSSNSQSQILGCIMHDFVENIAVSSIVAYIVSGAVFVVYDVAAAVAISCITALSLVVFASFGRISRLEAIMLIILFVLVSIIVGVV